MLLHSGIFGDDKQAVMKPIVLKAILVSVPGFLVWLMVTETAVYWHGPDLLTLVAAYVVALISIYIFWWIVPVTGSSSRAVSRWNQRIHSGLGWFLLCGPFLLAIGYLTRPHEIDAEEMDRVSMAVLTYGLNDWHGDSQQAGHETVFIRFGDKGSPEPAFLSQLGQAHPGLHLSLWSDRPEEDPACKLTEVLPLNPCGKDDYLALKDIYFPFWRVARVTLRTLACHRVITAVKGMGRWHVIHEYWGCA